MSGATSCATRGGLPWRFPVPEPGRLPVEPEGEREGGESLPGPGLLLRGLPPGPIDELQAIGGADLVCAEGGQDPVEDHKLEFLGLPDGGEVELDPLADPPALVGAAVEEHIHESLLSLADLEHAGSLEGFPHEPGIRAALGDAKPDAGARFVPLDCVQKGSGLGSAILPELDRGARFVLAILPGSRPVPAED